MYTTLGSKMMAGE